MNVIGVIPARYDSSRFPGKPLVDIGGKSMIQRVYEQCSKSTSISKLIVATDDQRIADHVKLFGGNVTLTSINHQSGTDRCAEVANNYPEFDILINIQGDEPMINPDQIDLLCKCFENPNASIATLVKKISSNEELFNENTPKVILNKNNEAILFSRTAIPFIRGKAKENWIEQYTFYKHIGIYGFKTETLKKLNNLPVSALESAEALEQLRWIENGYRIHTAITDKESQAIDTPQDLEKLLKWINEC
jgi:3-deoxy-manno-octulosonate cytidylyltransferase (CMP-KDO synthetase)